MKTAPVPAVPPLPSLSRRGFLLLAARVLPLMLLLGPARCNSRPTPTPKAAGYGSGKYGAGKYGKG
jgi:hypothetical protein